MSPRHKDLLEAMLCDMEDADPLYQPTHYWRQCSMRLLEDLERYGLEQFRAIPAALTHFVPTYVLAGLAGDQARYETVATALRNVLPEGRKAALELDGFLSGRSQALADYRVYLASYQDKAPYTFDVTESQVGSPVGQHRLDGRRYSRSMLNYLLGLNFAKQHVDDLPVRTVLEIGGGFGTLGEILLNDARNRTYYIDVDIPPTAVFATYYLEAVLGADAVTDYSKTRGAIALPIERLRRDGHAAIVCPWQLPLMTGEVDLFVNFISFQEMEPDVVQSYLSHVDRLSARFVLLRNIREGREIAQSDIELGVKTPVVSADYDRFLPGYELIASNVLPFGFATVDGFHSELRLYRRSCGRGRQ